MLFFAALCLLFGTMPDLLYAHLPYRAAFVPYTGDHVVAQLQLLLFSGLAFFLMLPWLKRTLTITLDTDWIYRRAGAALARCTASRTRAIWHQASRIMDDARKSGLALLSRHFRDGALAGEIPSGAMAAIAVALLAIYLLLYMLR
jgi:multicomponent Na+:H+ antiporter subunit D